MVGNRLSDITKPFGDIDMRVEQDKDTWIKEVFNDLHKVWPHEKSRVREKLLVSSVKIRERTKNLLVVPKYSRLEVLALWRYEVFSGYLGFMGLVNA